MPILVLPSPTFSRIRRPVLSAFLIFILFGCTTPTQVDVKHKEKLEQYSLEVYDTLPPSKVFKVSKINSILRVYVGREGPLSNLGHNHVISSKNLSGYIYLPDNEDNAFADLNILVHDLIVDDIEERSLAGEDNISTLSDSNITNTLANMLNRDVLDAANYPEVSIHIQLTELIGENAQFNIVLNFKDNRIPLRLTGTLVRDGNQLTIESQFELDHQQLSIRQFATLGGALRVAETLGFQLLVSAESQ